MDDRAMLLLLVLIIAFDNVDINGIPNEGGSSIDRFVIQREPPLN